MDAALFVPTADELRQTRHEMRELLTRFPSLYDRPGSIRLHDVATVVKVARLIGLTPRRHLTTNGGRGVDYYRYSPKARFRYITESYLSPNDVLVGIAIATGEIELNDDGEPIYSICRTNWAVIDHEACLHGIDIRGHVSMPEPQTYSINLPWTSYKEIVDHEDII